MKEPEILVGIMSAQKINFVLHGDFTASNNKVYNGSYDAEYQSDKIIFDNISFDELKFIPVNEKSFFELIDVVIGIGFHWERKENQSFKGNLKLIKENKNIRAINEVKVEDYLTSVISSEMSATASEELLKAHAVISRSWLLHPPAQDKFINTEKESKERIIRWYERDAHTNFNVCADDHCQRYQGITRASTPTVEKAINATQGEVLMYDNEICDTRFSKCCGGISESFENAWAPVHYPYLTKITDNPVMPVGYNTNLKIEKNAEKWILNSPEAFCNTTEPKVLSQILNNYDQETTDFYRWKVEYSQQQLSELISRKSCIDFGEIIDLIPLMRGESGRIIELKIVGTKQTVTVGKELEIRKWLSESHLYSSAFIVEKCDFINNIPQKFTIIGAGWGHGVGLCQIGAAVMGEKGYKYDEILLHYFKDTELKKIY